MSQVFCAYSGNQSWQVWVSLRGKTKMAECKIGRIQDYCHYQVEWEWMSLSEIELVWVRVRVELGCIWVNLREDNKVSKLQDGSVWIQHGRVQDGCHHQVESEWMSEGFFVEIVLNQSWQVWVSLRGKTKMAECKLWEFKIAAIIKLSENEWVWVRLN